MEDLGLFLIVMAFPILFLFVLVRLGSRDIDPNTDIDAMSRRRRGAFFMEEFGRKVADMTFEVWNFFRKIIRKLVKCLFN